MASNGDGGGGEPCGTPPDDDGIPRGLLALPGVAVGVMEGLAPWELLATGTAARRAWMGVLDYPGGLRFKSGRGRRWTSDPALLAAADRSFCSPRERGVRRADPKRVWAVGRGDGLVALGRWACILALCSEAGLEGAGRILAGGRPWNRREESRSMGQAFSWWLEEFRRLFPPATPPHWECPMEVALRLLNLALARELLSAAGVLQDRTDSGFTNLLEEHGQFLLENREDAFLAPNNHHVACLVGLLLYGLLLPDQERGRLVVQEARLLLCEEMERQVLPTGESFEGSTNYHCLATELFTAAFLLLRGDLARKRKAEPLPPAWVERLHKMFTVMRNLTLPNFRGPNVGDVDGGRVFHLDCRDHADLRGLLGLAAVLFGDLSLLQGGEGEGCSHGVAAVGEPAGTGEVGRWLVRSGPMALWLLGDEVRDTFAGRRDAPDRGDATGAAGWVELPGLAGGVVHRPPFAVMLPFGPTGQEGMGGHAHNDGLAPVVYGAGGPILVDPGTFVYMADEEERHQYRSTAFHGTIRVDGMEQNPIWRERPFFLPDTAQFDFRVAVEPEHQEGAPKTRSEWTCCEGVHDGFMRKAGVAHHRRLMVRGGQSGLCTVEDVLEGTGRHMVEMVFRFPPYRMGRPLRMLKGHGARLLEMWLEVNGGESPPGGRSPVGSLSPCDGVVDDRQTVGLLPSWTQPLVGVLLLDWHAPTYGRRVPAQMLVYRGWVELPWRAACHVMERAIFRSAHQRKD